jgi:hypothetical protein
MDLTAAEFSDITMEVDDEIGHRNEDISMEVDLGAGGDEIVGSYVQFEADLNKVNRPTPITHIGIKRRKLSRKIFPRNAQHRLPQMMTWKMQWSSPPLTIST